MANEKNNAGLSAIQRATSHYNGLNIREIQVPEWGDESGPYVFYVKPFTLQDQGKLQFAIKNSSEADALAEILILKAMDQEGNKLFNVGDKQKLRTQVDAQVLARVANDIMGGETEAELEKN